MRSYKTFCWTVKLSELCEGSLVMKSNFRNCLTVYLERILIPHFVDAFCFSHCMPEHGKFNLIQWNPRYNECCGTEKNVRYSGVFVVAKTRPVITNYLVNNKNNRYSRVTKLNQAEEWDIHHAKQSTHLCVNSNI